MKQQPPSSKTLTYLAGIGAADVTQASNLSRHNRQEQPVNSHALLQIWENLTRSRLK